MLIIFTGKNDMMSDIFLNIPEYWGEVYEEKSVEKCCSLMKLSEGYLGHIARLFVLLCILDNCFKNCQTMSQ